MKKEYTKLELEIIYEPTDILTASIYNTTDEDTTGRNDGSFGSEWDILG